MSKVKKYSLLVVTALLLCVSFVLGGLMISGNSERVSAEPTNTFEMVTGASAPINTEGGLRFRVKMSENVKDGSAGKLSVIFIKKEVFDAGKAKELSHAQIYDVVTANDACVEIQIDPEKVYEEDGFWYANAVLTKIQNKKWNFVAIAKFGENFTGNYAYNNLYNVINSAFIDAEEGITAKILKNTSYSWYGNGDFPVVVNNETELNRIFTRCSNEKVLIKTNGFIATEDVYALNRNVSQTFTLDETPTGTFTTNIDGFTASVSGNILTVTKTTYAGTANGLILKVSNGNGFVKYISLVDFAIGTQKEFDNWYSIDGSNVGNYTANLNAYVVLTANIDASAVVSYKWREGYHTNAFTGVFDGRGHYIANLSTAKGFIPNLSGTLKNVALIDTYTRTPSEAFVGYMINSGAVMENVYYQGVQNTREWADGASSTGFVTAAYSSVKNVVVIIGDDRAVGGSAAAVVNNYNVNFKASGLYIVNPVSNGKLVGSLTAYDGIKTYETEADMKAEVTSVPVGFDTNIWTFDHVDGRLTFKSVAISKVAIDAAEEIGVLANNKEFNSSSSKEIPQSFDIDFGVAETPVKVYANGNEIDFTNKSSGVITINPKAIYTAYGANDYLIRIMLSTQMVGYKLVLASYEVSNVDEFKWLFSAESLKIDGVGAALFDGRTSGYAWPTDQKYPDTYIIVTNDIDVGGYGCADLHTLSGKLDGRNHVISNFTAAWNGLFYSLETTGVIKNLAMTNVKFSNGSAQIFGNKIAGVLENCYFEATGGGGQSILTNNFATTTIIKNVVVIGSNLGANISTKPKVSTNIIQGNISNLYVVTESENGYIAGTQTSYAGVNVYGSIADFKSAVKIVPPGFDAEVWTITANDGLRMKLAPDGIAHYDKEYNLDLTTKGFAIDTTYTVPGFDTIYKKSNIESGSLNINQWTDFRDTKKDNTNIQQYGLAFMITKDGNLNIGPQLKANTWYFITVFETDAGKDKDGYNKFIVYMSTYGKDAGFKEVVGVESSFTGTGSYTPCIQEALRIKTVGGVAYDMYTSKIYIAGSQKIGPISGDVIKVDDVSYTEKYFSKNKTGETLDGLGEVYTKDATFSTNASEGKNALSFTCWSGNVLPNYTNIRFAFKTSKACNLCCAQDGFRLEADTWYYFYLIEKDSKYTYYVSTVGYDSGFELVSNNCTKIPTSVDLSGSIFQLNTVDYVDQSVTFYTTAIYGTPKA